MLRPRLPAPAPARLQRRLRIALLPLLLALLSATLPAARATPFPEDPVEVFKKVLSDRSRIRKPANPEEKEASEKALKADLDAREAELRTAAAKLVTIDQIARAIALKEAWESNSRFDEPIVIERDGQVRGELRKRLQETIKARLTSRDPADQVATLVYLSETAGEARRTNPPNRPVIELCRDQGPLVIQATEDSNGLVVQTALRTLGQIQPDPKTAMPVLTKFLQSPDPDLRIASADAMKDGAQLLSTALRDSPTDQSAVARMEFQKNCQFLVAGAKEGLNDKSQVIRERILDALQIIASELRDDAKQLGIKGQQEYSPLLTEFQKAIAYLPPFVSDQDPRVRLNAINIIKDLGHARSSLSNVKTPETPLLSVPKPAFNYPSTPLKQPISRSVPTPARDRMAIQLVAYQPPLPLPIQIRKLTADELKPTLDVLIIGLKDPNDEARLAAAEALATLGDQALPALKELIAATSDKNEFVRWASLRALGRLDPHEPDLVVPVLAAHLNETDLDVRKVAAYAISRYGPKATAAVIPLAQSIVVGDADYRVQALRALESIGTDAKGAIPAIASNVTNSDHDVRLAAVQLLGRFGPLAIGQAKVIQKALTDEDPGIRKAAAVTLLAIEGK